MDVSEALRRGYFRAIGELRVNGTVIPMFSELVNPNVEIPRINAEMLLNISTTVDGEEKILLDNTSSEVVLPSNTYPVNPASPLVYVVIQGQEESEGLQNYCSYRQNCQLTIRVVTKFETSGAVSATYAETVSDVIQKLIKPTGKTHSLMDSNGYSFQRVEKVMSRLITEHNNGKTAISKVIIYNNIVNQ